jgi:hypothetical protein
MSKDYSHGKISFGGTIGPSQDWSCGYSFLFDGTLIEVDMQAIAQAAAAAARTAWNAGSGGGIQNINAADTGLYYARSYWYPAGTDKAQLVGEAPVIGTNVGNGSNQMPTTVALVVSTKSGLPGRSRRGRMYLPATSVALTNHQLGQQQVGALAGSIATMFDTMNSTVFAAGSLNCVIAAADIPIPITSVAIDSRPDTQRRRGDKVLAAFVGTAGVNS